MYSIQYHIVRCVKYRRKVLIDDIEKNLKELLIEISNENNIKIIEMETDLDHNISYLIFWKYSKEFL